MYPDVKLFLSRVGGFHQSTWQVETHVTAKSTCWFVGCLKMFEAKGCIPRLVPQKPTTWGVDDLFLISCAARCRRLFRRFVWFLFDTMVIGICLKQIWWWHAGEYVWNMFGIFVVLLCHSDMSCCSIILHEPSQGRARPSNSEPRRCACWFNTQVLKGILVADRWFLMYSGDLF